MKKVLIIFLVTLVMPVFTSNITISASQENIEITEKEEAFFRKELMAQVFQNEGVLVVDTINSHGVETIIVDGVEYEKRAIAYQLLISETKLEKLIEKYSKTLEKNKIEKLEKLESKIVQTLSVSDLVQYMNDEDLFDLTQILIEIIPDYKIDYDDYTLQIDYEYWDFYVGLYTDFDTINTNIGIYTRSSEYYKSEIVDFDWWASCPADTEYFSYVEKWNGCEKWKNQHTGNVKNTLNTTLDTFLHQETIELIDQVNYNVPGKYNVYVRARDVFGNERTKVFEVTVC